MNKVWKILVVVLLAICAISLSYNSYTAYNRAAQVAEIQTRITKVLSSVDDAQAAYEKNAYHNSQVDTISKQQLMASETTNTLLSALSLQISLLAQLQK